MMMLVISSVEIIVSLDTPVKYIISVETMKSRFLLYILDSASQT